MNESDPRLDDLALFLAVAEAGSLSGAAEQTGTPLPTLSRRMTGFERELGRALFLRGKAGYTLSTDGRALADELKGLHDIRSRVRRWHSQNTGPVPVRITAGFWTSRLLAQKLEPNEDPVWLPSFVPSNAALDLARREADIGIRNRAPDHPWLARQRLREITYAIYAVSEAVSGFVTLPRDVPAPPSQRWLREQHAAQINTTASDTRLCLDLALRGFGQIVLPCFVGDSEPALMRRSDPISALAHDEWLVSHHEARHDPPIRSALDEIAAIFGAL